MSKSRRLRWLVDENLSPVVAGVLRDAGQDVEHQAVLNFGLADPAVLAASRTAGRIVVTQDKGFGALVFRGGQACEGVVLMRVETDDHAEIAGALAWHLDELLTRMPGEFATIDDRGLRSRPLP